jgi:hypothetical protein
MFNKSVRKFSNLCKASFESEISAQILKEEAEAKQMMDGLKVTSIAVDNIKKDALTEKLQADKDRFI